MPKKIRLGQDIEPSIAREAKRRMSEAGKAAAPGKPGTSVPTFDEPTRTHDEVARTVGLGSGRTYERGKDVLEKVAAEPDGEQLLSHVDSGDWDIDDVHGSFCRLRSASARGRNSRIESRYTSSITRS